MIITEIHCAECGERIIITQDSSLEKIRRGEDLLCAKCQENEGLYETRG